MRVPLETARAIRDVCRYLAVVGPHASTTPRALNKLQADVAVMGECEEILPLLAGEWSSVPSICYRDGDTVRVTGSPRAADMSQLPALYWDPAALARHKHHHHRFDATPEGPCAEMETSRGCPYHCTFCAKDNFRNQFRKRPLETIAAELDGLVEASVSHVYLIIDEILLPNQPLLELLAGRGIRFGIQTRIDLWSEPMLDLLGRAGCVSVEAGVESITEQGRAALDKKCKLSTKEITDRLVFAKQRIPFVQANLLDSKDDHPLEVRAWRERLLRHGVWANEPVPMFSYPGSPGYTLRWGEAGDRAWERAHETYLAQFVDFSDIQEQRPRPLISWNPSRETRLRRTNLSTES